MNIKKIVAGVFACYIVGGAIPTVKNVTSNIFITASAVDYTEGTYEQLTYKKYSDHIEISKCNKEATEVVIPDKIEGVPVKSIGDWAFSNCSSLTSITIPDSVTSIGTQAFCDCTGLTSITIPDSIKGIGGGIFSGCSGLTSITIPDSIKIIGDGVFLGCSGLTSIKIPDSVTSIGGGAFGGCSGLTSIKIPYSVTSIGRKAFSGCSSLTTIEIPDSVTNIGDEVFSNCTSLKSVKIPDGVTSIGNAAFSSCESLTSITIPDSVTSINAWTFSSCSGLKSVTILNPECEIYDDANTISDTATIYGYENSTAQAYAQKYNCKFESLGKAPAIEQPDINILGDANCDGAVNIADATAIVQHLGNQDKYGLSEHGLINADCCNVGDGVTGLDALAIQKLEAGMIDSLPDTN